MNAHYKYLSLLCGLLCIISPPTFGEVVQGFADFSLGAWNFSDQTSADPFSAEADLYFAYVVDPPLGDWIVAVNGAAIVLVDSTFDELTTAPEDSSLYNSDLPAILGIAYVIRTPEGHYAKFTVHQLYPDIVMEYVYQPNGTRILIDYVPVEQITWGRIKSLYQ